MIICRCIFYLVFLFLINLGSVYSQNYRSGLIAEVAELSTRQSFYGYSPENNEFISSYSLYYSGQIGISRDYRIEFRPGYIFYSASDTRFFPNFQLGLFLRRNLFDPLFIALGGSFEFNTSANSSIGSQIEFITYSVGANIGIKLDQKYSLLLSYYSPIKEVYGHTGGLGLQYEKSLLWFVKIGVELNL